MLRRYIIPIYYIDSDNLTVHIWQQNFYSFQTVYLQPYKGYTYTMHLWTGPF